MIPTNISFYISNKTIYQDDDSIDRAYDEQRREEFAELEEELCDSQINYEAIRFEDDYFYKKGRKHGKVRGKQGGRPTKKKFSEENPNTFHNINQRKIQQKKTNTNMIKERTDVRELTRPLEKRHFSKGQEINLCGQEIHTEEQNRQFMSRKEAEDDLFNQWFEDYWENMEETNQQNEEEYDDYQKRMIDYEKQLYFIESNIVPLEVDLVNLESSKETIQNEINCINNQLTEWTQLKRVAYRQDPIATNNLGNNVFPKWRNYSKYWTDDILFGISNPDYPNWQEDDPYYVNNE